MAELKHNPFREPHHQKAHSNMCGGSQSSLDTRPLLPTPTPGHLEVNSIEESPLPSNKWVGSLFCHLLGPLSLVTFPCCLPFLQEGVFQTSVQPISWVPCPPPYHLYL